MDRVWELREQYLSDFFVTLYLAGGGLLLGGLLGLVIGTSLYVTRTGGILPNRLVNALLNLVVNFFRPIPFILLAIALQSAVRGLGITAIGNTYAIIVIVFASAFAIARIVEQNLLSVQPGVLEAARAMGASRWRVITTVLLPEAYGLLVLGFTFASVAIVDMTAVVGVIAANGLGDLALTYGQRQFNPWVTWSAIFLVIVIVQTVQFLGNAWARKVLRR
jgi:D-methionine transport system permease protein